MKPKPRRDPQPIEALYKNLRNLKWAAQYRLVRLHEFPTHLITLLKASGIAPGSREGKFLQLFAAAVDAAHKNERPQHD